MSIYLIIILTVLFSAFFSGMEIAFISANKLRIEVERKQGLFASRIIQIFNDNPSNYITTMLVGNNIALVIYGTLTASLLKPPINNYITENESITLIIQTILSTLVILVTAEFVPKAIFRNIANASLNVLAVPLLIFYYAFFPITLIISFLSNLILARVKSENDNETNIQVFNKIDLAYYIDQGTDSEQERVEKEDEIKLFQNALDFSSVKLRDCMVPRNEIVAFDKTADISEIKQAFIDTGYSKILIYDGSIDNVFGYTISKDVFLTDCTEIPIIKLSFFPETMTANKLLKKLITDKKSISVVVDEFGGVSGLITIEDLIEEIFGEIEDEHDTTDLLEKKLSENEYLFSGRFEIDYLNDKYNLNLPVSEDYETLAGLLIHAYESIPEHHEIIKIENFELKVIKVSNTKVELIRLTISS